MPILDDLHENLTSALHSNGVKRHPMLLRGEEDGRGEFVRYVDRILSDDPPDDDYGHEQELFSGQAEEAEEGYDGHPSEDMPRGTDIILDPAFEGHSEITTFWCSSCDGAAAFDSSSPSAIRGGNRALLWHPNTNRERNLSKNQIERNIQKLHMLMN
jgi:hypothetical protein